MDKQIVKPLLRGHFHQAAFFVAFGACMMLVAKTREPMAFAACSIYSISLIALFGISALYHRPNWDPRARARMRRLDHTAIFALIAGTAVPISLLGVQGKMGRELLAVIALGGAVGMTRSIFWITAPKWLSTILYFIVGCLAIPFLPALKAGLSPNSLLCLIGGGIIYAIGAIIYAVKRPNPWPRTFGYHEIFHVLVIIAAFFHFLVINQLVN